MRKYVLDTNVFVRADRDPAWGEQLAPFYAAFLPFTYLHAVVVQERLPGAVDTRRALAVYEGCVKPFELRGRLLTPSYRAWRRSGQVIATLVRRRRPRPGGFGRSFLNDALLAASCREAGATLVTMNARDSTGTARLSRVRSTVLVSR